VAAVGGLATAEYTSLWGNSLPDLPGY